MSTKIKYTEKTKYTTSGSFKNKDYSITFLIDSLCLNTGYLSCDFYLLHIPSDNRVLKQSFDIPGESSLKDHKKIINIFLNNAQIFLNQLKTSELPKI